MKPATWETSLGALAALLNTSTQLFMAELYTFTLPGGATKLYTSNDQAVVVNGKTYAIGPAIRRGKIKLCIGIMVDTLDVTMAADPTVLVNGTPLLSFIAAGGFDGARLSLDRAFTSAPGAAWVGVLSMFQGRVSDATITRYESTLTISSDSELLNVMVPRGVYAPGCPNTLFDGACGKLKTAYAIAGTATSVSDSTRNVFSTALAQATGYFDLGFILGVTGANAGVQRTVKAFAAGVVTTVNPWPAAVAVSDTFTLYPGCDKTFTTCVSKFANGVRFRGHPFVPAPETIA